MQAPIHKLAALAVFCCLVPAAGCAATAERTSEMFGKLAGGKSPEQALNIKTPDDHIQELRALAKTAAKKTPAEQERIIGPAGQRHQARVRPADAAADSAHFGRVSHALAFAVLTAGFTDSDLEVRRVACESMGRRGGPDAVHELARVAGGDTDIDVRIAAVRALGKPTTSRLCPPWPKRWSIPIRPCSSARRSRCARSAAVTLAATCRLGSEYAKTGQTDAPEVNLAERIRRDYF